MLRYLRIAVFCVCFVAINLAVIAQDATTCPTIVDTVVDSVDKNCKDLGRNKVCYGNDNIIATLKGADPQIFNTVGDVTSVTDVRSLRLSALDITSSQWGIALFQLVALNVENSSPGQTVTIVTFGDTQFDIAATADELVDEESSANGEQLGAFILRSGIGSDQCDAMQTNGILVQSDSNAGVAILQLNGVQIDLGSTLFAHTTPGNNLNIYTLGGSVNVTVDGTTFSAPVGAFVSVPMTDDLQPSGAPLIVQMSQPEQMSLLPFALLNAPIDLPDPDVVGNSLLESSGIAIVNIDNTSLNGRTIELNLTVTRPWINSGIQLVSGETVTITASGSAFTCTGDGCPFNGAASPAGLPDTQGCGDCLVQNVVEMALVGRVGDGEGFVIGEAYTFTAEEDGLLYLAANDGIGAYDDNEGTFSVAISIGR